MTHRPDPHYAVMRVKRVTSWAHAFWVGAHNARTMEVGNADPDAPKPVNFVGGGDVLAELRAAHLRFAPKARKGAVLGLEFVFSASSEAFDGLDAAGRSVKGIELTMAAQAYLRERYPQDGQVVSLTLHLDETTPHAHAVVIPVHMRVDGRGGEREYYYDGAGQRRWRPKAPEARKADWMLSAARDMGGIGNMVREQTRWAEHAAHLGLVRGRHRSGARHVTNKQHEALLAARTVEAQQARAFADRERDAAIRERGDLVERLAAMEAAEADLEVRRATVAADEARLAALQAELEEAKRSLGEAEREVAAGQARLDERAKKASAWEKAAERRHQAQERRQADQNLRERELSDRQAEGSEAVEHHGRAIAELETVVFFLRKVTGRDSVLSLRAAELTACIEATVAKRTRRHVNYGAMVQSGAERFIGLRNEGRLS